MTMSEQPVTKAVILVGGPSSGTRFRPLSLHTPKPLFPVAGYPLIVHQLRALTKVPSISQVFIIGFFEDSVFEPFIKGHSFPFHVCYRREYQALGTAGGLYHFRDEIRRGGTELVFVLHSDVVVGLPLNEMRNAHMQRNQGLCTVFATKVPADQSTRYGSIIADPSTHQVLHYVEKPENFMSDMVNAGIYLLSVGIFEEMRKLREVDDPTYFSPMMSASVEYGSTPDGITIGSPYQPSYAQKYSSTSSLDRAANERLRLEQDVLRHMAGHGKLYVFESRTSFWKQIKNAASALDANRLYLESMMMNDSQELRRTTSDDGPTIIEPVFIDESAQVSSKATIGPNVYVGAGTRIASGVRIRDSIILPDATIQANSCILHSIVGWRSTIGKWVRVEGTPNHDGYHSASLMVAGKKMPSATILGENVVVYSELIIRNCIVLPHKELKTSVQDDILM